MPAYKAKRTAFPFLLLLLIASILSTGIFLTTANKSEDEEIGLSCQPLDLSGEFRESEDVAYFERERIEAPSGLPSFLTDRQKAKVLGTSSTNERWVEVDLSEQKLMAWEGDNLFLETRVSTGLPWWPTPTGEFRIWIKLRATKMEGGSGKYYYYLPNVPYVMFFENDQIPGYKGYGLHGTYWHNDFGTQRSHGCVNLPTPIAEQLFYWASARDATNAGTRIVIHE